MAKFGDYFGALLFKLAKLSVLKMANYKTNNLAIWSHCVVVSSVAHVIVQVGRYGHKVQLYWCNLLNSVRVVLNDYQ